MKNESDVFSVERRQKVEEGLTKKRQEASEMEVIWQKGEPQTSSCD